MRNVKLILLNAEEAHERALILTAAGYRVDASANDRDERRREAVDCVAEKGGALSMDLTQPIVRAAGLSEKMVDYKICSIDDTWSALLFTKRKQA